MFDFIKKSIVVTVCIITIGYFLIPKYEMVTPEKRFNRVSGDLEKYSNNSYDKGWYKCS